ncbi:MAG TPA: phage head-tail connector protein [Clostridium sp.]
MELLIMLKRLLCVDLFDTSKDDILNYMLENSKIKASNFLGDVYTPSDPVLKLEFETNHFRGIVELAKYDYNNQKATNIKQYTEGKKSVTYRDSSDSIPKEIKAILGLPSIVMY